MATSSYAVGRWLPLTELGLAQLTFVTFAWFGRAEDSFLSEVLLGSFLVALAFWWGFEWDASSDAGNSLKSLLVGMGVALLTESVVIYAGITEPLPLAALAGGGLSAILLILLLRSRVMPRTPQQSVLLLGPGSVGKTMVSALQSKLAGVVAPEPCQTAAPVYLGGPPALPELLGRLNPAGLIVDTPDWVQHYSPRLLLHDKLRGRRIQTAASAYEDHFQRVNVQHYRPFHYWQEALSSNRRIMSLQAIYSNLVGLVLLVGLAPVLLLLGLATRLAAGPGPVFESIECLGFQKIPFARRSFRLTTRSGHPTRIGRLLARLNLTYLPQLFNLVRGEMALFGPVPVRLEFAQYFETLSPVFAYRFSMRPGVFGWAQAHDGGGETSPQSAVEKLAAGMRLQEESERIGYDLYYLEQGSPFLDLEIIAQSLSNSLTAWKR